MELLLKVLCCIFVPPLAVALHRKPCGAEVVLNFALWVLICHIGGVLHAFCIVFFEDDTHNWRLS